MTMNRLSTGALKRYINQYIYRHPVFVYPLALATIAGFRLAIFDVHGVEFIATAGLAFFCVAVAVIGTLINRFARFDTLSLDYFATIQEQQRIEKDIKLANLKENLERLGATTASQQIDKFSEKMQAFARVLKSKFKEGEIAYRQYQSIAEQIHLNALDNLVTIDTLMENNSTINVVELNRRLRNGKININESESLQERIYIHESNQHRVNELIAMNESALTELNRALQEVSGVSATTLNRRSMEASLLRLAEINQVTRTKFQGE